MNILRAIHEQGYTYKQIAERIKERTKIVYSWTSLSAISGRPQVSDKLAAILLLSFPDVAFEAVEER